MHLKPQNSWPPDVSALDALNDYTWREPPSGSFKCIEYKTNEHIMKNKLYANASKNNRCL